MLSFLLCLVLSIVLPAGAQVQEFDFYPEFRQWWFSLPADQRSPMDAVLSRYRSRLIGQNVPAAEIERRSQLIRTRRPDLERDFWNRFLTDRNPQFNTAPNRFLASVVENRSLGRALDVGMGEGRNALFLAKLGWDVTGFDPADKAVALASQRAHDLGLKLTSVVATDRDFDFGKEKWDLILLSWIPPNDPPKIIEALRPGGIVVFEGPRFWFGKNELLQRFSALRILTYQDQVDQGDYFRDRRMPVLRFVAEKADD